MDDEGAFLAALTANPADDVCRLVFADWLDEHEQQDKATYLRLVCRAKEALDTPDEEEVLRRISRICDHIPFEWREVTATRFDLVLIDYPSSGKIALVLLLRQLFGWGLAESVREVERIPNRLLATLPIEDVACTRDMLRDISSITLRIEASPIRTESAGNLPIARFDLEANFSWGFGRLRPDNDMQTAIEQTVRDFVRSHSPNYPARISRMGWGIYAVVVEDVPMQVITRLLRTLDHEGREIAKRFSVQFSMRSHSTKSSGG